jgi:hypothetical protein
MIKARPRLENSVALIPYCPLGPPPESNHTNVGVVIPPTGNRKTRRGRLDCVHLWGIDDETLAGSVRGDCSGSGKHLAVRRSSEHSSPPSGRCALFPSQISVDQCSAFLRWPGFQHRRLFQPRRTGHRTPRMFSVFLRPKWRYVPSTELSQPEGEDLSAHHR